MRWFRRISLNDIEIALYHTAHIITSAIKQYGQRGNDLHPIHLVRWCKFLLEAPMHSLQPYIQGIKWIWVNGKVT